MIKPPSPILAEQYVPQGSADATWALWIKPNGKDRVKVADIDPNDDLGEEVAEAVACGLADRYNQHARLVALVRKFARGVTEQDTYDEAKELLLEVE